MKIFFDVDTQNDFMNPTGKLYVPDAELIRPNLKLLTDFARANKVPITGSIDAHTVDDPEFKVFPPHCIQGTEGQWKIPETALISPGTKNAFGDGHEIPAQDRITYIPYELDNRIDRLRIARGFVDICNENYCTDNKPGLYFEKQSYDVFTNPNVEAFLKIAGVNEAVVYGVATDYCVRAAVLGMEQRGVQCYVVEDAIKGVAPDTSKSALEEMTRAGAKLVTTKQVLEGKL